ncbi:nucleotidyltransferase domain-containing protein [Geomicrobium sp. JCM 19037]|uniref:nucleotidyltransferase domain-containing protein n=1 Tax=Geomicrobium sp. JCM 19037 TaxID=1460634 RepID=UPI001267D99D|nr:nucleotidyltransferase domain-containing protein [Geomicrobium sp. JCM 19037]
MMETLMEVAKAIADTYDTHLPYAELLLVGGSVARGRADEDSDLELNVLWKNPPSDDDRLKPIGVHKGTLLEFYPFEENEWSESYEINGLKIEMSHYLTEYAMQTIEDVLVQYDPAIDKQWLISSIQDGIALGNEEWFHHLQQRVMCYPEVEKRDDRPF